jgi:hypothetical protein
VRPLSHLISFYIASIRIFNNAVCGISDRHRLYDGRCDHAVVLCAAVWSPSICSSFDFVAVGRSMGQSAGVGNEGGE